jgi:hypothetical protein
MLYHKTAVRFTTVEQPVHYRLYVLADFEQTSANLTRLSDAYRATEGAEVWVTVIHSTSTHRVQGIRRCQRTEL